MTTTIKHTEVADFDDQGTTISVTATSDIDETETFHIQTVGGEYRYSLGCLIFTNTDVDVYKEDYPDFYFDQIIEAAENVAERSLDPTLLPNPHYYNDVASPYEDRFINNNGE